jgi:hypothetical protein
MEHEFIERRRHQRVQISLPIQGKCLHRLFKSHRFKGETRDLSYDGLCIEIPNRNGFKPGQRLKFKTKLYEGDFSIKGQGTICWVDLPNEEDQPIQMGVKLNHIRRYGTWCERIEDRLTAKQN